MKSGSPQGDIGEKMHDMHDDPVVETVRFRTVRTGPVLEMTRRTADSWLWAHRATLALMALMLLLPLQPIRLCRLSVVGRAP